ncbi:MAG: CBS domain-containing protein [Acetobacteraceae bacterium]
MRVADIMTRDVVTVGPDADISEIVTLLVRNNISAVPVVQDGLVLGVVSEGDLLRRAEIGTEPKRSRWLEFISTSTASAADYIRSHARKASEIMTRPAVTVNADASIADVASLLESRGIKRAPVVRDGRLVGIVSRGNILRALASRLDWAPARDNADDRQIQDALYRELSGKSWAPAVARCSIVVQDGVVHLWGYLDDPVQVQAVVVAAENIPGVKQVVDHTVRHLPYGV